MRPSDTEEIAIVGMQATEARELAVAAEAVGLTVRLLAFGLGLELLDVGAFAASKKSGARRCSLSWGIGVETESTCAVPTSAPFSRLPST
jgi:hypothetical protein